MGDYEWFFGKDPIYSQMSHETMIHKKLLYYYWSIGAFWPELNKCLFSQIGKFKKKTKEKSNKGYVYPSSAAYILTEREISPQIHLKTFSLTHFQRIPQSKSWLPASYKPYYVMSKGCSLSCELSPIDLWSLPSTKLPSEQHDFCFLSKEKHPLRNKYNTNRLEFIYLFQG